MFDWNDFVTAIVVLLLMALFRVEDWIIAWRADTSNCPSECFDRYGDIDANERGYNDAAGWLLYGHVPSDVEDSLIDGDTDPEYDEGVWAAIADWARKIPSQTAISTCTPEVKEVVDGS